MCRRIPLIARVALGLLVMTSVASAAAADAPPGDPVTAKLDKAKTAYQQKVERIKADLLKDLDAKENQVRAKGDKKGVDQVKSERAAFTDHGTLPKCVPTTAYETRVRQARVEVEGTYQSVIKDLVRAKQDDRAAEVEAQLAAFHKTADGTSGVVDLLALIDVTKDGALGNWTESGGAVETDVTGKEWHVLRVPYTLPAEYELELTVVRLRGKSDILLGPVIDGRRFYVVIDGWASTASGISFIDGKGAKQNETTVAAGPFLTEGRASKVVAAVTLKGVTVSIDGKPVLKYVGPPTRLGGAQDAPVQAGLPFIGVMPGASFRIEALSLKPISGEGKPIRE